MPDLERKYMGRWKMPNDDHIKRSDALKAVCETCSEHGENGEPCDGHCGDYALIQNIPASDVAPMRHGRWIQTKDGDFACSLCGYIVKGEPMNYPPDGQMMLRTKGHRYCGDCGAKMEWGATI